LGHLAYAARRRRSWRREGRKSDQRRLGGLVPALLARWQMDADLLLPPGHAQSQRQDGRGAAAADARARKEAQSSQTADAAEILGGPGHDQRQFLVARFAEVRLRGLRKAIAPEAQGRPSTVRRPVNHPPRPLRCDLIRVQDELAVYDHLVHAGGVLVGLV